MSKTIGQFTHVLRGGTIQIYLDHWMHDMAGRVLISPYLMTAREIDDHVDALVEDLEAVRSRAKHALAAKSPN